ncbi:MAG: hypothetical protein ACE5F1_17390 [Planctomycetota bacterium]
MLFLSPVSLFLSFPAVQEFSVTNRSYQSVLVTPVGTTDRSSDACLLPLLFHGWPKVVSIRRGGFSLDPDETVAFMYDSYEIQLSSMVIEDQEGRVFALVLDRHGEDNAFTIPALSSLQPPYPEVRKAALGPRVRLVPFLFNCGGFLPILLVILAGSVKARHGMGR